MCCTFNMEQANKMFVDTQYSKQVAQMQAKEKSCALPEGGVELPQWYIDDKEPVPQAGVNKGLSLILDAHTDLLSPGISKQ